MGKENPIVLFDGVCKLCNGAVDFILKRDKNKCFQFVALQSEEGVELVEKFKISLEIDSLILIKDDKLFIESEAAIEIACLLPTPWNCLSGFRIIPKKLRDRIYKWIARNRYRWFGKRDVCRIV